MIMDLLAFALTPPWQYVVIVAGLAVLALWVTT